MCLNAHEENTQSKRELHAHAQAQAQEAGAEARGQAVVKLCGVHFHTPLQDHSCVKVSHDALFASVAKCALNIAQKTISKMRILS